MTSKKLTAVTFIESTLIKRLKDAGIFISKFDYKLLEQAKAMEKEQIIHAFETTYKISRIVAEKYYKETYEI